VLETAPVLIQINTADLVVVPPMLPDRRSGVLNAEDEIIRLEVAAGRPTGETAIEIESRAVPGGWQRHLTCWDDR
jgi:hypothetical protein